MTYIDIGCGRVHAETDNKMGTGYITSIDRSTHFDSILKNRRCKASTWFFLFLHLSISCRQTALEALRAWPGGLHMGGGISTSNARDYLDAGKDTCMLLIPLDPFHAEL